MNRVIPFIRDNIAPILLSTAVVSSIAYIYACGSFIAILLFFVISLGVSFLLFALFEWLKRKGRVLLSTGAVTAALLISLALGKSVNDIDDLTTLTLWFMEPSRFTEVHFGSTVLIILTVGTILISSLYYFTRVMYRRLFLFLICLCPFCLFAKTFTGIPVIFPIVIMTLFFFIMMSDSRNGSGVRADLSGTVRSMLAFVLIITVIASFFPKLESSPFREAFDEFITGVSIGTPGIADYTEFTDSSSVSTSDRTDETILFTFFGDNPKYVKRQCYNIYNLSDNTWGYYGDVQTGHSNWPRYCYFEDPTSLYELLGFTDTITPKQCWVRSPENDMHAMYTTDNMIDISLYNNDTKIYRTPLDEYFFDRKSETPVTAYTIEWVEFVPSAAFSAALTEEAATRISDGDDRIAATDAASYLRAKEDAQQYDDYLFSDEVMNSCYTSTDARKRVRELAERITSGLVDTYSKASAITDYFRSGEYIYDNDFTTPDGSPDYFIFSSKRGACAAYATAMTLMCRELGMSARYCEGFLIQKFDSEGGYNYVTAADTHAFVQVWLDGYGWTTFDPTSFTEDNGYFDMTFIYVGAAAALIVAIGVLFIALRPKLTEARFVRRTRTARGAAQYSLVYGRINAVVNRYIGSRENLLTPSDTADKCRELFAFDADDFVRKYEAAVYGGEETTDNCAPIYKDFTAAYKRRLKEDKKCRKQKKALFRGTK